MSKVYKCKLCHTDSRLDDTVIELAVGSHLKGIRLYEIPECDSRADKNEQLWYYDVLRRCLVGDNDARVN